MLGRRSMGAVNRFWLFCFCIMVLGCTAPRQRPPSADTQTVPAQTHPTEPFFRAREHTTEYLGPGRDVPPPEDIAEVKIAYFGPDDPDHPVAGQMWQAVTLAVEEANAGGGYNGLPFRLKTSWSPDPWGSGIKGITRLVYDDNVWAVIGAPDGPSAHLVEQVVTKARLAFISPVATDKTTNLANVPWIFSCAPSDDLLAPALAQALISQTAGGSFALVSSTDHDARVFTTELLTALDKLGAFPGRHLQFNPDAADFDTQLRSIRHSFPDALVLIAGPRDAARFLVALRRGQPVLPVFGGPAMGHRRFLETDGRFTDGVRFPLLWHPAIACEHSAMFARRFEERFGIEPDYTAAHTYDAMNLLLDAIREAGLNRVRIRDVVRRLSPWTGVTGTITWDPTGRNRRPVHLGTVQNGRVVPAG